MAAAVPVDVVADAVVVESSRTSGLDGRRGLQQRRSAAPRVVCYVCCVLLLRRMAPIYSRRSSNSGGPIELQGRLHPAVAWAAAQLSRGDDRRRGVESRSRESLMDG